MVDVGSRAKKQQEMIMYSDFISNLPENVIDRILVRLPILDAVRTSVLSTNWRYKWTTITQLVFHDKLLLPYPHDDKDKLINLINLVFLLHSGFIHKFELSAKRCLISSSMIDAWILFLSRKNIKEFVLKFSRLREPYKLPTCFFSCAQQITTLELHSCVLKPPPTFTGFSNLKSLYLDEPTFVDDKDGFECLISKCPLLERLTWSNNFLIHIGHLNICSPNLKYLNLSSPFEDICFENTPLLSDVSISLICCITDQTVRIETRNMVKVLSCLPSLKKFVVNSGFMQFLSCGKIPVKLPFTCHHLNSLYMHLNFNDVYQICVTLSLLNSSPNLRELGIYSYTVRKPGHDIENFWNERTHIDWEMSRLQVVTIKEFSGIELKLGLEFIKLLLANSPMLEILSFKNSVLLKMVPDKKNMLLLLQLLRFKRASPKAVIEFPGFGSRREFLDSV